MPSVIIAPVVIEIDQQIEAPIHREPFVEIEVEVHAEHATRHCLVHSAAFEIGVRKELGDAGEFL